MKLELLPKSMALALVAIGVVTSCSSVEGPEAVAVKFLNACRDGDKRTIAQLSIGAESIPALRWRKLGGESHRDDQGTVDVFLKDLETYRQVKGRLLELTRRHQRLVGQSPKLDPEIFRDKEGKVIQEIDSLLVELERLKIRHSGMFSLLEAGVLSRILGGKSIQDFSGSYDVKIYFYFAEVSSVSPHEVRIHQQIRIALTKVSLGAVETDWLVYKTNDLTP